MANRANQTSSQNRFGYLFKKVLLPLALILLLAWAVQVVERSAPANDPVQSVAVSSADTSSAASQAVSAPQSTAASASSVDENATKTPDEDGRYTDAEEVALYLDTYGHLPDNYLTKNEAQNLGWNSSDGNLDEVAPGMSIGGDRFGNYEGNLPTAKGRTWRECDIDYEGGYRGSQRLLYSNDGLYYYTDDHYKTFTQIVPGA